VKPAAPRERRPVGEWESGRIGPGESRDLSILVGESYSGMSVRIPIHVRRGVADGPVLFVTAALHGDEINGTGVVRALIRDESATPLRGAVILVPVVNVLAFERHSRYLPDRRDLTRCFPGLRKGSLSSRMARIIFEEIVSRADYGIDLHTAAIRRTNYPNVRGDLADPAVRRLAKAFGAEFVVDGVGPKGALRREACRAGCATILMEGGEVWKVEPSIVETSLRGIRNVMIELGMLEGEPRRPAFEVVLKKTRWMRADRAGFLRFHVAPGDVVAKDAPLATNTSLLGRPGEVIRAPFDGAVLGMTTLPSVGPGEPVFHLARLEKGTERLERILRRLPEGHEHDRLADDLSTNLLVVDPGPDPAG